MTSDVMATLAKWNETLVRDEDDTIAICFGLSVTLYFHNGHTAEKRRASLECFNEYEKLCGSSLRWHRVTANSSRFSPTAKLRNRDMSPYLLSSEWEQEELRDQAWAFYWHGGDHKDDASALKINAFGSPRMKAELHNSLSFIQMSFPILQFGDKLELFYEFVLRCCELLKPFHGYGGIALITSPDRGLVQSYSPDIAAFAFRYPGIEIDRPMSHKFAIQEGIKGGNWLTILSNHFVEKLDGSDNIIKKLEEPFVLESYNDGILVIAGTAPEVGDRNRNIDTPQYRKLAKVLRPIRIRYHPCVYPKGRFSEEGVFAEWMARFDE